MSRGTQLLLVLAVGFLLPVSKSLFVFLGHRSLPAATPGKIALMVVYQAVGLLCLYLVVRYQKRTFKDIGFSLPIRIPEVGHAFALFLGGLVVALAVRVAESAVYAGLGVEMPQRFNPAAVFGSQIGIATVCMALLNPFHEELLVRAFLITEMEQLYRSTALAVIASVALQTSYHLYQGLPSAILHSSTFLLFSIYFVRTRRILPVIMAHMFMDVSALAVYAHDIGGR